MLRLEAIREQGCAKADFFKWEVCADAAEALISLAFECASLRYYSTIHCKTLYWTKHTHISCAFSLPLR